MFIMWSVLEVPQRVPPTCTIQTSRTGDVKGRGGGGVVGQQAFLFDGQDKRHVARNRACATGACHRGHFQLKSEKSVSIDHTRPFIQT